jgi:hypothetical protein
MVDEEQPCVILIKELYERPVELTMQLPSYDVQQKSHYSPISRDTIGTFLGIVYLRDPAQRLWRVNVYPYMPENPTCRNDFIV